MQKHNYNFEQFYAEKSNSYYLLGALMTDGCIYKYKDRPNKKVITLTSKDKDWLEIINQLICPNKPLIQHGENCFRLMYNSSKLADWLINKGCTERKSLNLKFPTIPQEYLPDFIRGCWDGDGSLSHTKSANKGKSYQSQANLTTGSLDFCQSLCKILIDHDIKCKIYPHGTVGRKIDNRVINGNGCWRAVLSGGGSVYNLVKLMYYSPNILCMPRKQNIAQAIIDHRESL